MSVSQFRDLAHSFPVKGITLEVGLGETLDIFFIFLKTEAFSLIWKHRTYATSHCSLGMFPIR